MSRGKFLLLSMLSPFVAEALLADYGKYTTQRGLDTDGNYLKYPVRCDAGYEEMKKIAASYMKERPNTKNVLAQIDGIAGLAGVDVTDIGISSCGNNGVRKIRYGHGPHKVATMCDSCPTTEPSATFPWIESIKTARRMFDPNEITYMAYMLQGAYLHTRYALKDIGRDAEKEAEWSKIIFTTKGESPTGDSKISGGGFRVMELSLGLDKLNGRKKNRETLLAEMERMAFETGIPLFNYEKGRIYNRKTDGTTRTFMPIVSGKNKFDIPTCKSRVFAAGLADCMFEYDILKQLYGDDVPKIPNGDYYSIMETNSTLIDLIGSENTFFDARIEGTGNEMDHVLADMVFLNTVI